MPITKASEFSNSTFDYLIVGGGLAGLTLAARLSEDKDVQVGVIEAGHHITDMPEIIIPGYIGRALGNPDVDWMLNSVPQKSLKNRTVSLARGKVLGGSSEINFTQLSRASETEYNAFEELGNTGWNWSEFLKYFRKTEKLTSASLDYAAKYKVKPSTLTTGIEGPLSKTYPVWLPDLHVPFMDSMSELGVSVNTDPNNGNDVGVFTGTFSIDPKTATRCSSTKAYYEPNSQRPNMQIVTGAQATRVLTHHTPDGVIATGVEFIHGGRTFAAHASREVILSAGAFKTPQLLEFSGIGNPEIIEPLGIETVIELSSVGENLRESYLDHVLVPVIREVSPDTQSLEMLGDPAFFEEQLALYNTQNKGMLSSVHAGYALVPLDKISDDEKRSEIRQKIMEEKEKASTSTKKLYELQAKWLEDPNQAQLEFINCATWMPLGEPGELAPRVGSRYNSFFVILMHPFSFGSVHVSSSDPLANPTIDPHYLHSAADVDLLVEGVRFARKVMTTGPLAKCHKEFSQPGPDLSTDEQLGEFVRKYATSCWHPLGSASMLPKKDGGVVDPDLIVYGTRNLRVVDASIIPIQLSCHIQATVYAIAEKAADIIKKKYKKY